eukprot:TRINITY_DN10088_c0_g1_i1.p1 TRINITY_DN10088_c0_g1~~TRINITY_DN10088_c0_g1_i1.p1  ORF type:complete len:590 (-),score=99.48 TRINITY_DN10088_c0_g1_i1:59-1747(-)
MAFVSRIELFVFLLCVGVVAASGHGFLTGRRGHTRSSVTDLLNAMESVMGCGGEVEHETLKTLEKELLPSWRVLPKTTGGLVEWKMVRYLAHRYFVQKSSLLVRGFEPMRQINSSFIGAAQILETHVPSFVDFAIKGRSEDGYSLQQAVAMIATLDQLIRDDEAMRLEKVYEHLRISTKKEIKAALLHEILEAYMVYFMMDGEQDTIDEMLEKPIMRSEIIPNWADIQSFVAGLVKETEFGRHRFPKHGQSLVAWSGLYSFGDAHEVVGVITKSFASFWEDECQYIKQSLVAMDKSAIGRLSLSAFYGANSDGEWRFGESEAYLRDLGALDESSVLRGKQVVIPNYLQGASNCIVATTHYLVCCVDECEPVLDEIEDAVGGPLAKPEEILPLVGNMTGIDDDPKKIDTLLRDQLLRIAETHDGTVPLHGRLFAQWLHYVFPRECQFPHKKGTRIAHTPFQYGDGSLVSDDVVAMHAARRNESLSLEHDLDDAQWMSQWSEEEELLVNFPLQLESPWGRSRRGMLVCGAMLLIIISVFSVRGGFAPRASRRESSDVVGKSHYV